MSRSCAVPTPPPPPDPSERLRRKSRRGPSSSPCRRFSKSNRPRNNTPQLLFRGLLSPIPVPRRYNCRMRAVLALLILPAIIHAQVILQPARVFDGETMHEGWAVRVRGDRIEAAGPASGIDPADAKIIPLPGATLMPGLVEGHSHILLHAYNETK